MLPSSCSTSVTCKDKPRVAVCISLDSSYLSKDESGARYSLFLTPKEGLQEMVGKLAARLSDIEIRLNTAVDRIVSIYATYTLPRSSGCTKVTIGGAWRIFKDYLLSCRIDFQINGTQ